jgi:hypothetical protein
MYMISIRLSNTRRMGFNTYDIIDLK